MAGIQPVSFLGAPAPYVRPQPILENLERCEVGPGPLLN